MKRIRLTLLTALTVLCAAAVSVTLAAPGPNPAGRITLLDNGPATIHSFMGPESDGLVTTQIIELPNKLVVIDTQFTRRSAKQVRRYIDGLQKPIDRVILSHAHPDHWFGLEFYSGLPIYALKEVRDQLHRMGEKMIESKRAKLGDRVTDTMVAVTHLVEEGSEKIDGLTFEYQRVGAAEADVQLLIRLPEIKTLVVQDLVYNNVHLFVGQNALASWQAELETISAMNGYTTLLVGHGEPAAMSTIQNTRSYLVEAQSAITTSGNGVELKSKLVEKYPDHRADFLLDISSQYLYH